MKRFINALIFGVITQCSLANAADIASCSSPNGYAYYADSGAVAKKDSGWVKDGISGGKVQLVKNEKKEYDLLYVDITKQVSSSRADGAKVYIVRSTNKNLAVFINYPGNTSEIYTFWANRDGKLQYSQLQSKGGDNLVLIKSALFVGNCDYVNFNLVD